MTLLTSRFKLFSLLALFVLALNTMIIPQSHAGTILGDNQENTLRFFYQLINGPPVSGDYAGSFSGPSDGLLGMIRQITGPSALGGGLTTAGILTCADVPSTGTAAVNEGGNTFLMNFQTPLITIPTGYTGATSTFDKRVTVQYNGTTFMNIEFQCGTNVGWLRFFDNQAYATPSAARHVEVFWDTELATSTKMDLYMYYEQGLATGNEYFSTKFETSGTTFKIWITRAVDYTGTSSDVSTRAALFGDTSNDVVNAYMLNFGSGAASTLTDTGVNFTDNNDINLVGDLQCVNFNNGGIAADASGSCGALTLTAAGVPPIDGSGDASINWVYSSMKSSMTTVLAP